MRLKSVFKSFALAFYIFLLGTAEAGKENSKIEEAKQQAEIYAQRSLKARNKPAPKLTPEQEKAEALIQKADLLVAQAESEKELNQALELLEKAVEIAPNYERAWASLGKGLWAKANFMTNNAKVERAEMLKILAEAKQACQKALQIEPMSPDGNYWLSNILLTEASLGNWLKGAFILPTIFQLTDKVAEVDPYYEYGAVFRTYAVVLTIVPQWLSARLGFTPEVIIPYLDKAIELFPDYFANYNLRAGIYLKLGGEKNKQRALADLEYVLTHHPQVPPIIEAENHREQKHAQKLWNQITGKPYPER